MSALALGIGAGIFCSVTAVGGASAVMLTATAMLTVTIVTVY